MYFSHDLICHFVCFWLHKCFSCSRSQSRASNRYPQFPDSVADSSEEVSRYFPTPSPRKPSVPQHHPQQQQHPSNAHAHVQTAYQNLPDNAAAAMRNLGWDSVEI